MNRATTKGIKRIRQSAWCCRRNFQRWRFRGNNEFPAGGHTHCPVCGNPLIFKKVTNANLDRYYRNREKNVTAGLTCYAGTKPRRTNFNIPTPVDKAWRSIRAEIQVPDESWDQTELFRPLSRVAQ